MLIADSDSPSVTTPRHRLDRLFTPRNVAVIGASRDPSKLGAAMMRSLSTFPGTVVGVNPRDADPDACRFGSVAEASQALGAPFDLAILCVPAGSSVGALSAAGHDGVRAAVVCSGGFAEAGAAGAALQSELARAARDCGVTLLGPNTSGFVNPGLRLAASFVPGAATVRPGPVAVVAASGGVNHALAFLLADAGLGVSLAVGIGNAADVTAADVLGYLGTDQATRAVALHIESVANGAALTAAVRALTDRVPVAALVVGEHDSSDFARSHTGAMATSWRMTRAALSAAGAVVVDDERGLVDAVNALSALRLLPRLRPSVGVVTGQAGPGLLHVDGLVKRGVHVPALDDATRQRLGDLLPPLTFQANPVDTGRPNEAFGDVISAVAKDSSIDLVSIYALVEPDTFDIAATLSALAPMPMVVGTGGQVEDMTRVREHLRQLGVPTLTSPAGLTEAVSALVRDSRSRARARRRVEIGRPSSHPPGVIELLSQSALDEHEAKTLLELLGIRSPRRRICTSDAEACHALGELSVPVVVKLLDASVTHKSDVGGVVLDVANVDQLERALAIVRAAGARRVLVEEMAEPGPDLVVGAIRDAVFGPMVLVGVGGVMAEAIDDVVAWPAPLPAVEASELLDDLRAQRILDGFRGGPAVDRPAVGQIVSILGELVAAHAHIESIEINPLRVTTAGPVALDAAITFVGATRESVVSDIHQCEWEVHRNG